MHIGLLEDDTAIQEMLRLVLEDEGYTVTVYSTADACLNALTAQDHSGAETRIDLLIVDWRLSGSIPGTEVIRKLRDDTSFDSLPIILTTAATFNNTEELQKLHFSLLEKPFTVDEVADMIKELVSTPTDG